MQTKLTVRVDARWLESAKRYAEQHDTTLSKLVSEFLRTLAAPEIQLKQTPILHRLAGVLPPDVTIAQRRAYLDKKYGL